MPFFHNILPDEPLFYRKKAQLKGLNGSSSINKKVNSFNDFQHSGAVGRTFQANLTVRRGNSTLSRVRLVKFQNQNAIFSQKGIN